MKRALVFVRRLVGITGLFQLALGVVFWTGHLPGLVPLHMAIGVLFVLGLATLAALGLRAGAPAGLAIATIAWALVIPAVGMAQMQLLPGPGHWIVRVAHLATGIVGMGLADAVFARARGGSGSRHAGGRMVPGGSSEAA